MSSIGSVIIVGGGASGLHVARLLAQKKESVDVTLVDRQDYFDWSVASPRMLAEPERIEEDTYVMPTAKVLEYIGKRKDGSNLTKFVQGAVKTISAKSVTLENGKVLEADAIVVAIGGQYGNGSIWKPLPSHTTKEARIKAFKDLHDKAAKAKGVVVAGAGHVGVEVAGELKAALPNVEVTLVGRVVARSSEEFQRRVKKHLIAGGVVLKDGHIDVDAPDKDGNVVTREGETIPGVDLVLKATGFTFAGDKLADASLKKDVSKRGQFNCRSTLQLQSCDSVFAVGDIVVVPEGFYSDVKGTYHAQATGATAADNVVAFLQKKTPLADFAWSDKPIETPVMATLSRKDTVADMGMPNFLQNFMGRMLKSKNYFANLQRKNFGYGTTW